MNSSSSEQQREISRMLNALRHNVQELDGYDTYAQQHGMRSAPNLTVTDGEIAAAITERIAARIQGKVVVEIGGGLGLLSLFMGAVAKKVYCIEANPMWSMFFTQFLFDMKRTNVSYCFGAAEEFRGLIKGDVSVICTHSDVAGLKALGGLFADQVIDVYGEMIEATPERFDPVARSLRSLS